MNREKIEAIKIAIIERIDSVGFKNTHASLRVRYPEEYKMMFNIFPQLSKREDFSEICYWILNDLTDFPMCPVCNSAKCKYINLMKGYSKTCSVKCGSNYNFAIAGKINISPTPELDKKYLAMLNDLDLNFNGQYSRMIATEHKDLYSYVDHRYDEIAKLQSFPEKLYWFINNMSSFPVCPRCGSEITSSGFRNIIFGYSTYHPTCFQNTDEIKSKIRTTINTDAQNDPEYWMKKENKRKSTKEKMGYSPNWNNSEQAVQTRQQHAIDDPDFIKKINEKTKATHLKNGHPENWNNTEKAIQTNLERYGVMYSFQREDVKQKCRETNLKNRNVEYPAQSPECWNTYRKTCREKYGYEYPTQSPELQNQIQLTKKLRGTYRKSHEEDEVYNILKFIFPRIERQYKSDLYPFNCDFYDPDHDIYFEYNGFMTHGNHFFNPNNENDILTLKKWKEKAESGKPLYQASIDTWTVYDVRKREIAKKNNINYVVFWKVDDARNYVMNYFMK